MAQSRKFFRQSTPKAKRPPELLFLDKERMWILGSMYQPKNVMRSAIPFGATGGRDGLITTPRSVTSTRAAG